MNWNKDKSGKQCTAKTCYVISFAIVMIRVLFGGMTLGDFTMPAADISQLSLLIAATGAIYYGRNHTKETHNDS